jgi:hypothetical protein
MATSGSNPGGAGAAQATAGTPPAPLPVVLKVSFTLNTPDGLRQINFGLEKDSDGVKVNWTINFTLYERTDPAKPYGDPLVSLNVLVAATLHANAEIAAAQGLTPEQAAHAMGPGANAAKAIQDGSLPAATGEKIIQRTLA